MIRRRMNSRCDLDQFIVVNSEAAVERGSSAWRGVLDERETERQRVGGLDRARGGTSPRNAVTLTQLFDEGERGVEVA